MPDFRQDFTVCIHAQAKVLKHDIQWVKFDPLEAVGNLVIAGDFPNRSQREAKREGGDRGLGLGKTELER